MSKIKMAGAVVLLLGALAAAGFSLYRTYLDKPADNLTAEERAAAQKAVEAFSQSPSQRGK